MTSTMMKMKLQGKRIVKTDRSVHVRVRPTPPQVMAVPEDHFERVIYNFRRKNA